jgi:16S rRNA (cytosine1402-N4)-methyltransferase
VTDSQLNRRMRLVGRSVKASAEEVAGNVRARSAVMRIAEKIN